MDVFHLLGSFGHRAAVVCAAARREVENLTGHYVFFLGAYRGLYILNWVYRSYYEQFYRHNWLVYVSGAVQTALYVDFFYYRRLEVLRRQADAAHVSDPPLLLA